VPAARSDTQLLLIAGALAVVAGLLVALVLLLWSGEREERDPEPFVYGPVADLERSLRDEGPFYVADPFGGDDSIAFALEDGDPVAIAVNQTDMPDCTVKWRAQLDRFTCGDERFTSEQLERFVTEVPSSGPNEGQLVIDVRRRTPAPSPATTPPSS
jgi:hypothetical protein